MRRADATAAVGNDRHRAGESTMWQHISTAPFDRDIELAVIDDHGAHALVFPCRRILNGWMKAETRERLDVRPTHWRIWNGGPLSAS